MLSKPAASCICPHCVTNVPLRRTCRACGEPLSFAAFKTRLQEIYQLERLLKLEDDRD